MWSMWILIIRFNFTSFDHGVLSKFEQHFELKLTLQKTGTCAWDKDGFRSYWNAVYYDGYKSIMLNLNSNLKVTT